jgi:hypothetical protein
MILRIVFGRADIDAPIATGTLLRIAARLGRWRRLIGSRLLRNSQHHGRPNNRRNQQNLEHRVDTILSRRRKRIGPIQPFLGPIRRQDFLRHKRHEVCWRDGRRPGVEESESKKPGRPYLNGLAGEVLRGGGENFYRDEGLGLATGGVVLGVWAGVVVAPAPVLVMRRMSTRRFLARPSLVLFDSTGLSLPSPMT